VATFSAAAMAASQVGAVSHVLCLPPPNPHTVLLFLF
jgi:hypothetical protein